VDIGKSWEMKIVKVFWQFIVDQVMYKFPFLNFQDIIDFQDVILLENWFCMRIILTFGNDPDGSLLNFCDIS